jgi:hypothetical protein
MRYIINIDFLQFLACSYNFIVITCQERIDKSVDQLSDNPAIRYQLEQIFTIIYILYNESVCRIT